MAVLAGPVAQGQSFAGRLSGDPDCAEERTRPFRPVAAHLETALQETGCSIGELRWPLAGRGLEKSPDDLLLDDRLRP